MKKSSLINEIKSTIKKHTLVENEDKEKPSDGLYQRVQTLLDNPLYNHAEIMRRLGWEGDDNTNRSKFLKKLNKEKNDDGSQYLFTTEELEKIISIIDNPTKTG